MCVAVREMAAMLMLMGFLLVAYDLISVYKHCKHSWLEIECLTAARHSTNSYILTHSRRGMK